MTRGPKGGHADHASGGPRGCNYVEVTPPVSRILLFDEDNSKPTHAQWRTPCEFLMV